MDKYQKISPTQKRHEHIQKMNLGILKEVDKVCRKFNVPYSISSGTLLGAVRHGGHIPWDNDADIDISYINEEIFFNTMKENLPKRYKTVWAKDYPKMKSSYGGYIVDTKTPVKSWRGIEDHNSVPEGLRLDVFMFFPTSRKRLEKDFQWITHRRFRNRKHYKLDEKIASVFFKMIPNKFYWKKINKAKFESIDPKGTKSFTLFDAHKKTYDYIFPTDPGKFKDIKFDGLTLRCVADTDTYLKALYGNYMEMPSEKERVNSPWR